MAAGEFPSEGMELTHILVVGDAGRARDFYRDVLGAELYRQYGGTSVVLRVFGTWLLLVTGGGPTADKPDVTFAVPADPPTVSHAMTIRVPDCRAAYETLRGRGAEFLTPPWSRSGRCAASSATPTGTCWSSASQRWQGAGRSQRAGIDPGGAGRGEAEAEGGAAAGA
jgi:predicted enzyme related to lactoylglutathione lyase